MLVDNTGHGNTTHVTTTYITNNISNSFNDSSNRVAYNMGGCLLLAALPILLGFLCYLTAFTNIVAMVF